MKKTAKTHMPMKAIAQFIAIGTLVACSSDPGNPVQEATVAMEQQDYRAARIHLMTALRSDSQDPQANLLYAEVLAKLGDGDGAEAALRKLDGNGEYQDRVKPLLARAMLLRGQNEKALEIASASGGKANSSLNAVKVMALFGLGRDEDALAALDEALVAAPREAELLWIKGNRELTTGNLDAASQSAALALKQKPDSMEALLLTARLSLAKANGKDALADLAKIRELRPDNIVAEYLRGVVQKDLGARDEARGHFEAVLSEANNHPWATYFLAQMDHEDGFSDKAFNRLQTFKADISEVPGALRLTGILASQRGSYEQAISKLQQYLAQNAPDAEAIAALANALSGAGNDAQAYQAIKELAQSVAAPAEILEQAAILAKKAGSPDAAEYGTRAAALKSDSDKNKVFQAEQAIIAQDWAKAAAIYDGLLAKPHPQKVMLLNNAAMAQLNLSKADEAIKLAKQASELAPDDPIIKDTLGWILLQSRQDKAAALVLLQGAATAMPQSSEVQWHLANALAVNGKIEEAKQIVSKLQPIAQGNQKVQIENLLAWL